MELRVHGIGDHGNLSAQGSGRQLSSAKPVRGVLLYQAPIAPAHEVRFVNWTRTSRSRVPLMWYFAFPYTLLNVAGHMTPTRFARFHHAVILTWGVILTLGTWLWLVLIAEQAIGFIANSKQVSILFGQWAAVGIALVLTAILWVRSRRRTGVSRTDAWLRTSVAVQSVFLAVAVYWALSSKPAVNTGPGFECWLGSPDKRCMVFDGDAVTKFALLSCITAVGIAVLLMVLNIISKDWTWSGTTADPLLGTGLVIVASTVLLNVAWSALRLAVEWGLAYFSRQFPALDWRVPPPNSEEQSGWNILRPWHWSDGLYGPDMLVGMLTPLLVLSLAVPFLAASIRRIAALLNRHTRETAPGRGQRVIHSVICDASPARLTIFASLLLALISLSCGLWLLYAAKLNRFEGPFRFPTASGDGDWFELLRQLTVLSVHLLILVVVLILLLPQIRKPLAVIGDVAGYWDMKWHGLAALPYRASVTNFLMSEIQAFPGVVVLVGHSQGSVLAFDAVKGLRGNCKDKLFLVTCGSPLRSLYSRFFPNVFDSGVHDRVRHGVRAWANFWRDTDPIGCPLFRSDTKNGSSEQDLMDIKLVDPPPAPVQPDRDPLRPKLRGHSDYWLEEHQNELIQRLHRAATADIPSTGRDEETS